MLSIYVFFKHARYVLISHTSLSLLRKLYNLTYVLAKIVFCGSSITRHFENSCKNYVKIREIPPEIFFDKYGRSILLWYDIDIVNCYDWKCSNISFKPYCISSLFWNFKKIKILTLISALRYEWNFKSL